MKYKTVIEIVSEANDKDEAVDIVGDYLSGNLMSGVDMRCRTRPVHKYNKYVVGAVAVVLLVAVSAIPIFHMKHVPSVIPAISGMDAIQPPLKTSAADKRDADFKKAWHDRQTKAALDFLKQR